ncbi:MAG: ATP-dependent Clp protease adapter ClpS [Candidatus Thioglobus sp.]|nr:ATP-dependent Clp protease adapter ClpS [Candidatus Thioglobus sp.]
MDAVLAKKSKPKLKKPKRFQVILLNDDYTPMEFVVEVLMQFFSKNEPSANAIMLKIHLDGEAVCGIFSFDVAQTKSTQVIDFARQNDQPLMCVIRELDA